MTVCAVYPTEQRPKKPALMALNWQIVRVLSYFPAWN